MNTIRRSIFTTFFKAMQVQFFLSLLSLPVLVAWGLPFSVMTVVGNLIFTPVLTLFLLISSMLFFTELLALPNQWIVTALEKLFDLWIYFLQFGSTRWLFGIEKTGLILCIAMALAALIILQHKQWGRPKKSWWLLGLLLLVPFTYQTIRSYFVHQATVTCIRKTMTLQSSNGLINAVDSGALGEKKAAGTWVQYNLLGEALKQCGTIHFDTIKCPYPNQRTLEALITLCKHAPIKKIELTHPFRKNKSYKTTLKKLLTTAQEYGVIVNQLERTTESFTLALSNT